MPDINALMAKFFAAGADLAPDDATFPYQSAGNTVTPLVDGDNYFGALRIEVNALKAAGGTKKFFYFTNWWLSLVKDPGGTAGAGSGVTAWTANIDPSNAFKLDDGSGGPFPEFIEELAEMAANGTDVRGLIWVSPLVLAHEEAAVRSGGIYPINAASLLSVDALRKKPNMGNKVCLNTLAHPLGAMHLKMVVCGDATGARGFVSGIDFESGRIDSQAHPNAATFGWHDAGAKVVGPAVLGIYGYFRQLWNEQISLSSETFRIGDKKVESYADGTPSVPTPPFPAAGGGTMRVQVLRTAPQMHFAFDDTARFPVGCFKRLVTGFRRDPWTFAPNGIFGFKAALEKAISNAETYIYVEDQGFYGHPIMEWLRDRLAVKPQLKLIMVHRADPADGPDKMRYTNVAINNHLGSAGANMNAQVAYFERTDHVVVHTKVWIIDDQYFIVGSANAFRRSLYTDGEISIGVIDENGTDTNAALRFRTLLWGEHCGLLTDAGRAPLADLDQALKIWDPTWGGIGVAPAVLLPVFHRKRVPFEVGPADDQWPALDLNVTDTDYDQNDADSRLEY